MTKNKFAKISEFFKEKREQSGMSQQDLSQMLGYKTKQIVSNWERGTCSPPLHQIAALIEVLKLNRHEVTEIFLDMARIEISENLKLKYSLKKSKSA